MPPSTEDCSVPDERREGDHCIRTSLAKVKIDSFPLRSNTMCRKFPSYSDVISEMENLPSKQAKADAAISLEATNEFMKPISQLLLPCNRLPGISIGRALQCNLRGATISDIVPSVERLEYLQSKVCPNDKEKLAPSIKPAAPFDHAQNHQMRLQESESDESHRCADLDLLGELQRASHLDNNSDEVVSRFLNKCQTDTASSCTNEVKSQQSHQMKRLYNVHSEATRNWEDHNMPVNVQSCAPDNWQTSEAYSSYSYPALSARPPVESSTKFLRPPLLRCPDPVRSVSHAKQGVLTGRLTIYGPENLRWHENHQFEYRDALPACSILRREGLTLRKNWGKEALDIYRIYTNHYVY